MRAFLLTLLLSPLPGTPPAQLPAPNPDGPAPGIARAAGPGRSGGQAGEDGPPRAWLELEAPGRTLWVGERMVVRAVVGVEAGLAATRLVPRLRQELELPLELVLPFASGVDCLEGLGPTAADAPRLVLNGRAAAAVPLPPVERDGVPYERHAVDLRFRVDCPGRALLAGATLRFAVASGFRDDPFSGRVALDPVEYARTAPELELELARLPEAGRPPGFGGAIGSFALAARADPRDVMLGESLRVTLEVRGRGNLGSFELPRPQGPGWEGFRLLGTTEAPLSGEAPGLAVTYDLAVRDADVRRVPPLELPCFRPEPDAEGGAPGYEVVRSEPITILVRPTPEPAASSGEPAGASPRQPGAARGPASSPGDAADAPPGPGSTAAESSTARIVGAAALALLALALAVAAVRRWRRPSRDAALSPHGRRLLEELDSGRPPDEALCDYLAARLNCAPAALAGGGLAPDHLRSRLTGLGALPQAAVRARALLLELEERRYAAGDRAPADLERDRREVRNLLAELEPN